MTQLETFDAHFTLHALEGNLQLLDGGAMYGNCPRALWSRWSPPDELNRIALACRALLIQDGPKLILAEAGIGAYMDPASRERFGVQPASHELLDSLKLLGISPSDITHIVLSHLHFDHAGGLLSAYEAGAPPSLVFPQAEYLVGKSHYQRALHPHVRDRASFIPALCPLLEASGRLTLVDGPHDHGLGSRYRFRQSEGHTPGLLHLELLSPRYLVFVSDLMPGMPWVNPPITMGYDRWPERLIEEKLELLSLVEQEDGLLFFTHDLHQAVCSLGRDPRGRPMAVPSTLPT